MTALVFAIGNTQRGDDGAAGEMARRLRASGRLKVRVVHQLMPECAYEMHETQAGMVVFADASVASEVVRLEPVAEAGPAPALGHHLTPEQVTAMARTLYGWSGAAWVCHIPGSEFAHGEGLTEAARAQAAAAALAVEELLSAPKR
jgi:hydrogenase maturation protease